MKINNKFKIAGVAIIVVGLGLTMGYGQINKTDNAYMELDGQVGAIQTQMKYRNELIDSLKGDAQKYDLAKKALELVEKEAKQLKNLDDFSENVEVLNEKVITLENVNKSVDKLIEAYDNDSNMKKDEELTKKINELIEVDYSIDDDIKRFNTTYRDKFNESIKKFPANVVADKMKWKSVKKLENN